MVFLQKMLSGESKLSLWPPYYLANSLTEISSGIPTFSLAVYTVQQKNVFSKCLLSQEYQNFVPVFLNEFPLKQIFVVKLS